MARLHTEVTRDLKNLLDRVALERKQEASTPYSQSDIVEQALWDWLVKQGYAKRK